MKDKQKLVLLVKGEAPRSAVGKRMEVKVEAPQKPESAPSKKRDIRVEKKITKKREIRERTTNPLKQQMLSAKRGRLVWRTMIDKRGRKTRRLVDPVNIEKNVRRIRPRNLKEEVVKRSMLAKSMVINKKINLTQKEAEQYLEAKILSEAKWECDNYDPADYTMITRSLYFSIVRDWRWDDSLVLNACRKVDFNMDYVKGILESNLDYLDELFGEPMDNNKCELEMPSM